jgi:hypothetical protein
MTNIPPATKNAFGTSAGKKMEKNLISREGVMLSPL